MRFKIIFFPLVVLLCFWVSIKWIWPEITRSGELKKEINEKQKILSNYSSERSKIKSLRNDMDTNKSEEVTVLNYFPVQKNEENIVNLVNYLATNSSVNLTDLSLEEKAISQTSAANSIQENVTSKETLFSPNFTGVSVQNEAAKQTRFFDSKIKASGSYQNLKIFLNQIYNMPIFNKVNSIAISKPAGAAAGGTKADLLDLNMDISFGYKLSFVMKENSALPGFPSSTFDFSNIKKIENSSAKVTPIADSNLTGRENPFLP